MDEQTFTLTLGEQLEKSIENMQGALEVLGRLVVLVEAIDRHVQQTDERLDRLERKVGLAKWTS